MRPAQGPEKRAAIYYRRDGKGRTAVVVVWCRATPPARSPPPNPGTLTHSAASPTKTPWGPSRLWKGEEGRKRGAIPVLTAFVRSHRSSQTWSCVETHCRQAKGEIVPVRRKRQRGSTRLELDCPSTGCGILPGRRLLVPDRLSRAVLCSASGALRRSQIRVE